MALNSIANLLLKIVSQKGEATTDVEELAVALEALDHTKAEATAQVDTDKGALDQLELQLAAFDSKKVDAKAGVDTKEGEAALQLFTHSLENLRSKSFKGQFFSAGDVGKLTDMFPHRGQLTIDADLDTTKAQAQAVALDAQLAFELKDQHVNVDVDRGGKASAAIGELISSFSALSSAGAGVQTALSKLGENIGGVTFNIGAFGLRLGPIVLAVLALASAIAISLVAAFAAVAATAVLAATALAALGVALVGAFAPIALIAIPVVIEFQKVMQALTSSHTDQAKAARDAAAAIREKSQADQAARSYAQQHADAERTLTTAIQNAADAQAQGMQSVADAQQNLVDTQKTANQQITDAVERAASAQKSAYREMQDAIEAASDAVRGLSHAQLTAEQSKLNFRKSEQALADFRKKIGAIGPEFDAMFRTFTDRSFDPSKLNAALANIRVPGLTGTDAKDNELQLEQLILDVKNARLSEKDATDGVSDAERNLHRARQDAKPFLENGIQGSKDYAAALKNLADTQVAAAKSIEAAQKGVITAQNNAAQSYKNALKGIADAQRGLRRIESDHAFNLLQQAASQRAANIQADAATTKTQRLSRQEQRLLDVVKGLIPVLKQAFGPAVSGFIDGIVGGLKLLGPAAQGLKQPMTELGKVMGTAVVDFFKLLTSPAALNLFGALIKGAQDLIPLVGAIFAPMLDLIGKIAIAAMPFLVARFQDIANLLTGIDKKTTLKDIRDFIAKIIPNLDKWASLLVSIIPPFFDFLVAIAPYGRNFLDFITKTAVQFGKWATSKQGREEIRNFFDKTIPIAIQFLGVVLGVIKAFVDFVTWLTNAANALSDFFSPIIDFFTTLYDALSTITTFLTGLNPFQIIIDSLTNIPIFAQAIDFAQMGLDIIKGIIEGISSGDLITAVVDIFKSMWKAVKDFLGIGSPSKLFRDIGVDIIRGLFNGITSFVIDFAKWIYDNIIKPAVNWLIKLPNDFFNYGKNIISSLFNGLTSIIVNVATWIYNNVIKPIVDWLVGLPVKFFNYGKDIISDLWRGLTSVVVDVATWIWKNAIKPAVDWLVRLPADFFNYGKNIVQSLWNGLTSIGFNFGGWVYDHIPGPLRSVLGMHSPSRLMMELGRDIGVGLEIGIKSTANRVSQAATQTFTAPVVAAAAGASAGGGTGTVIQNQTVNLPAAPGHDQMGDPRHQAALFAREMRRRAWR